MAVEREVLIERTTGSAFEGMKISWGGVFGGVLAGIGTLLLLSSLGLAIGVTAIDPRAPDASALGTGAAIWTGVSLLLALFIAGWASTRLSMLWERTTAMFEGVLVWVLSLILILYLAANGVGLVARGAFGMLGQTVQSVGVTAAQTAAEIQPEVATTAWVSFAALLLSLLAAIVGAAVGRRGVVGRVTR
jgi:hypothetical protein